MVFAKGIKRQIQFAIFQFFQRKNRITKPQGRHTCFSFALWKILQSLKWKPWRAYWVSVCWMLFGPIHSSPVRAGVFPKIFFVFHTQCNKYARPSKGGCSHLGMSLTSLFFLNEIIVVQELKCWHVQGLSSDFLIFPLPPFLRGLKSSRSCSYSVRGRREWSLRD